MQHENMFDLWNQRTSKDTSLRVQKGIRAQKSLNLSEFLGISRLRLQLFFFLIL